MNMREAFEEYAEGYCYYLDKDSEGKYKNPATALAWQIWKAAKKSPPLDFSGSQIGNREAEEVIRTMWANGMESEAQALADCFYGLVDANAALAVQAQQPKDSVGNWLWSQLMDYVKSRGMSPAVHDDLFKIVERARQQFDSPSQAQQESIESKKEWALKMAQLENGVADFSAGLAPDGGGE